MPPHPHSVTAQPEFTRNVQQYSKEVYLRTAEASQCRVHSVLVLPLFADARRRGALGVLELVTTTDDLPFDSIVATLDGILQVVFRQPRTVRVRARATVRARVLELVT